MSGGPNPNVLTLDLGGSYQLATQDGQSIPVVAAPYSGSVPVPGAGDPTFVYSPGNPNAGTLNFYGDWPSLMAAVALVPGNKWIQIDGSFSQPTGCTVPAGNWHVNNCTFTSVSPVGQSPSDGVLTFLPGASLSFLLLTLQGPYTVFLNTSTASVASLNAQTVIVEDGASLQTGGGDAAPFFTQAATATPSTIILQDGATLGDGEHTVVTVATACLLNLTVLSGSVVEANALGGAGTYEIANDVTATIAAPQNQVVTETEPVGLFPGLPNSTWNQGAWFIDPVNGNDTNPGTSLLPVQTIMGGIVPKWGAAALRSPVTTTFNLVNPQALNAEQIVLDITLTGQTANFIIEGTLPAPTLTATPTALSDLTRSNTDQRLNATFTSVAGLVPGMLAVDNTRGSRASVVAVNGNVVTFSQPFTTLTSASASRTLAPVEDTGWAVTDSFSFYVLPTLNLVELSVRGGDGQAGKGVFWMQNIYVPDITGTAGSSVFAPALPDCGVNTVDCTFQCNYAPQPSANPSPFWNRMVNCAFLGPSVTLPCLALNGGAKVYGGFVTGAATSVGWNALDGDFQITGGGVFDVFSGVLAIEGVYVGAGSSGILRVWGPAQTRQVTSLVAGFAYGPGQERLQGGLWTNATGASMATKNLVATLEIDAASSTASSYNPSTGAWTAGIAVTAANVDAAAGGALINPPTRATFSNAL